jgi:hypothetical protein
MLRKPRYAHRHVYIMRDKIVPLGLLAELLIKIACRSCGESDKRSYWHEFGTPFPRWYPRFCHKCEAALYRLERDCDIVDDDEVPF